jgi:hypothetical protein
VLIPPPDHTSRPGLIPSSGFIPPYGFHPNHLPVPIPFIPTSSKSPHNSPCPNQEPSSTVLSTPVPPEPINLKKKGQKTDTIEMPSHFIDLIKRLHGYVC